jgi:hypothetical protein
MPKSHIFKLPFDIKKLGLLMYWWMISFWCKYATALAATVAHFHRILHEITFRVVIYCTFYSNLFYLTGIGKRMEETPLLSIFHYKPEFS